MGVADGCFAAAVNYAASFPSSLFLDEQSFPPPQLRSRPKAREVKDYVCLLSAGYATSSVSRYGWGKQAHLIHSLVTLIASQGFL